MSKKEPAKQKQLERRVEELSTANTKLSLANKELQNRLLEYERLLMKFIQNKKMTPAEKKAWAEGLPLFDDVDSDQIELPAAEDEAQDDEEDQPRSNQNKTEKRGRKGLPKDLPRYEKKYDFDPERDLEDYDSSKGYTILSFEKSEELYIEPPKVYVIVHLRPVVAYTKTNGDTVAGTIGDPKKVFDKCMASPGVLAKIATDRYHYHLTLYRLERWFKDQQCPLARSTLCVWLMRLGVLLQPIRDAQKRAILKGFKVHTDDTNYEILRPGTGSTDKVKVWVLIGGTKEQKEIVFEFTQSRTSKEALAVLGGVRGYLQVDACNALDILFDGTRTEVGCWSHVVRKFKDVFAIDKRALPMLKMIRALYNVEETSEVMGLDYESKYYFRLLASQPILTRIQQWVAQEREKETLESSFKKALNYVNNHWKALTTFLDDGRLSLDNNCSENEFHVLGISRRNSLFFGSERGLDAGLVLMGLIRSCVANDINPRIYLEDVIGRMRDGSYTPEQLTPANWKHLPRQEATLLTDQLTPATVSN